MQCLEMEEPFCSGEDKSILQGWVRRRMAGSVSIVDPVFGFMFPRVVGVGRT